MKDTTQNRTDDYPQGIIDGNAEIICSNPNCPDYDMKAIIDWCETHGIEDPSTMTDEELERFIRKKN